MLKIAYDSIYTHPLPEGHRFPMMKYELIHEQLLYEGTCTAENFFSPASVDPGWVLGVHNKQYFDDLLNLRIDARMERRIGFPVTERLVQRELIITQGTIDCCKYAFEYGVSMNIAGGTHHAYADRGEGFCLLNDVAVAAHYLLARQLAKQILVVDLDVHQGNGTAVIFENEPRVFTFSMHGKENYPLKKERSDLDIELPTYCEDTHYLNLLFDTLPRLIEKVKPQFIFYISGVDILASDKLGKLKVSMEGCARRDAFVFEQARQHNIPVVVSMGGGYSPRIADIVEAHCNTFRLAEKLFF
ncbi:histone deacetylase [Emticicia sp. 21SJ11W-3]|uniref:histone deacetylase family protein n=1 Tax=Emticicia sp. 21SJ11W-3 TaxID=2916755 RepID=UPI0020A09AAB|nr:histone deacetylase [Emticicia sp. 21SJ11W-3]UTA67085.1 histone deacetylase [Emticicia sp. 21SJ11W-3]